MDPTRWDEWRIVKTRLPTGIVQLLDGRARVEGFSSKAARLGDKNLEDPEMKNSR